MVGYDPKAQGLSKKEIISAGALSGALTRTMAQPLDVLKIRFQLQSESISRGTVGSKYHNILQACASIYKEEGVTAFWKGLMPAQGLSVIFGVVQFYSFEVLTRQVYPHLPLVLVEEGKAATHFACGSLAGVLATLAAQPFDVIRTRVVAQGEPKVYHSMVHAASSMVHKEGLRSLYKGLAPTLLQIAPQTGFNFGFYALFKSAWALAFEAHSKVGVLESLVCGSLSGLCSKVATYPLDVIKKRLQVQGFEHGRSKFGHTPRYQNTLQCVQVILRDEGLAGLYKGLSPSMIKAMISVGCHFVIYEQCCNLFVYLHASPSSPSR